MKIKSTYLLLLAGFVLTCWMGCEPAIVYKSYPIAADIQDFQFQTNDYWIYERESDFAIDSLYITDVIEGDFTFMLNSRTEETWRYYRMNTHSSFLDLDSYDCLSNNYYRREAGDAPATRNGGRPLYLAPMNDWSWLSSSDRFSGQVSEVHFNLNVAGNNFAQVFEIDIMDQNTWTAIETYWVMRGVGVVRYEIRGATGDLETWSLLRWRLSN